MKLERKREPVIDAVLEIRGPCDCIVARGAAIRPSQDNIRNSISVTEASIINSSDHISISISINILIQVLVLVFVLMLVLVLV